MTHKVQDLNRRNLSFSKSKVKEVLPEYFAETYPNLVLFLEKYYEYLEGENADSFKREINNLFVARDPGQVDLESLDYIVREVGNGLKSSTFFDNPRLMTSLLSRFYRVKGSLNSIEGFFRGFFGQEVTVEYPKNQMFIVGESEIGYESLKFIQDNRLYQIFSILIKSALSSIEYNDLYLRFVHPAGFRYASQVTLTSNKEFGIVGLETGALRDSATAVPIIFEAPAAFNFTSSFAQLTGLLESDGGATPIRVTLSDYLNKYKDVLIEDLNGFYNTIIDLITPNSFTFDNSPVQVNDSDMSSFLLLASLGSTTYAPLLEDESDGAGRILGDINNSGNLSAADATSYNQYNLGSTTYAAYIDGVFKPTLLADPNKFAALLIPSDSGGGPDMSVTLETMDNGMYSVYLDSSGDSFY